MGNPGSVFVRTYCNRGRIMKYRNRKTGCVIDIKSRLDGGDWEPMGPVAKPPPEKKKVVRKKNVQLCDD